MNCQPSFTTGSVPLLGPALHELGWVHDAIPERPAQAAPALKRERPRRRVPDRDIVHVGAQASWQDEPVDVRDLAFIEAEAPPKPAVSIRGRYTKPLVALLILQITAVGGLYLKKRFTETQVIVIPATVNERAVIT